MPLVMRGKKGDIFWNLDPVITYQPGFDIGVRIFVANTTDSDMEYSLIAKLTSEETLISEEALPVYGSTWFLVKPGDFISLYGALRFEETDVDLNVFLIERESEEIIDSVSTHLTSYTPAGGELPPAWPTTPEQPHVWSWLMQMFMPFMMMAMIVPVLRTGEEES